MPADRDVLIFNGDAGQVVLTGPEARLPADAGHLLLPLARSSIAAQLGIGGAMGVSAPWLSEQGACFITLTQQGKLRGCIGTLRAHRALADDVRANAVAAAFRDPRFPPLTAGEYPGIALEISVLSALEALRTADEADALRQLRPGSDGLVFEYGHHSSTFLPQVWENFRDPADFVAQLKLKAGLPPDFWDPAVKLARYTVHKWREQP